MHKDKVSSDSILWDFASIVRGYVTQLRHAIQPHQIALRKLDQGVVGYFHWPNRRVHDKKRLVNPRRDRQTARSYSPKEDLE